MRSQASALRRGGVADAPQRNKMPAIALSTRGIVIGYDYWRYLAHTAHVLGQIRHSISVAENSLILRRAGCLRQS